MELVPLQELSSINCYNYRSYNEDRVSVILNFSRPNSYHGDDWPNCVFFGLYDGHGGSVCADYLSKNLHFFVTINS